MYREADRAKFFCAGVNKTHTGVGPERGFENN
jgi:hypothetical protein